MKQAQWQTLLDVVQGKDLPGMPVGFIIDSPWLPGWAGVDTISYLGSESVWLEANRKAEERFPQALFIPGFWAEFGMCTEPSAFGVKCTFPRRTFPHPEALTDDIEVLAKIKKPNAQTDGLLPLVIDQLRRTRPAMEGMGHAVRFATARGPLNIAAYLMGLTNFQLALRLNPDAAHAALRTITDFLVDWIRVQAEAFPTIDGIFLLDDIVGFLGPEDLETFALPYLKEAFAAVPAQVRAFHNDAHGLVCAPRLAETGINLFNFSHLHSLAEMKELTGGEVTLLGNIPPRDVVAQGKPEDVHEAVRKAFVGVTDKRRIILSCGGGVAPDTPSENIDALIEAAAQVPMHD